MRILPALGCQRSAPLVSFVMLVLSLLTSASARQPEVSFDLGYVVECRDVTPPAFSVLHPDKKVVEANLRVSVRVEKGDERDVEQLQFEITSPGGRLRVVDFLPRTQIEAVAAGAVEVVKTSETIRSVGATLGTTVSLGGGSNSMHGAVVTSALPAGNANATHRNELKETTRKIPPSKVVVSSGTLANEHGLFFKLRRTAAGTFEGVKPFSFRFVVPGDWRGDWLLISCQATGTVKHCFVKSVAEVGDMKAFLALHVAGDEVVNRAASALAEAQEQCLADTSLKDGRGLIHVLASDSGPWPSRIETSTASFKCMTVNCLKPATWGGAFNFGVAEKAHSCGAHERLKQTLDDMACFSAAPAP